MHTVHRKYKYVYLIMALQISVGAVHEEQMGKNYEACRGSDHNTHL